MAKYDHGGGCPCGLYKECCCEDMVCDHDWRPEDLTTGGILYRCAHCNVVETRAFGSYPKALGTTAVSPMTLADKWDKRYMDMAGEVGSWSKDPSSKIGAVAVNEKGQILSTGYNGFPRGIADTEERLNDRPIKYKLVVHAEMNAIFNATYNGVSLDDSTVYVSGLPTCIECAKGLIQVGVKRVVMDGDPHNERWADSVKEALALFDEAGVDWEFIV